MDSSSLPSIVISLIAAAAAIFTAKSTSKASTKNIESEAYNRARKFDTDTIVRQDAELKELRLENEKLKLKITNLEERLDTLEHPND